MSPYAHPLTGSPPLAVPPMLLAGITVLAVAGLLYRLPAGTPDRPPWLPTRSGGPGWTALPRAVAALALAGLAVVARWGPPFEPENLAAVSVVHVLWPGLLVAAALGGPVAVAALDGCRGLGAVERLGGDTAAADPPAAADPVAAGSVWPAAAVAAAWAWYLGDQAVSVEPRRLAVALSAYLVVTVAGCIALGRHRWLATAEPFGLLATWTAGLWRWRLAAWAPPRGAAALLGAVLGGAGFARLRLTGLWGDVALSPRAATWGRLGALGFVAAGAALAVLAARWAARRDAAGSVEAALVPVVAATAVAVGLRRSLVALQLLPQLLTDPLDRGWRLLGGFGESRVVDLNPGGTAVQQLLAWLVVSAGCVAGAWVLARRVSGVRRRDPGAVTLYAVAALLPLLLLTR